MLVLLALVQGVDGMVNSEGLHIEDLLVGPEVAGRRPVHPPDGVFQTHAATMPRGVDLETPREARPMRLIASWYSFSSSPPPPSPRLLLLLIVQRVSEVVRR